MLKIFWDYLQSGPTWDNLECIRDDFVRKKTAILLDFVQITSPTPQFGQVVQLFLNAKNVDLSDIQNDSLSEILLK